MNSIAYWIDRFAHGDVRAWWLGLALLCGGFAIGGIVQRVHSKRQQQQGEKS